MKETDEEKKISGKDSPGSWVGKISTVKVTMTSNMITDLMQSL